MKKNKLISIVTPTFNEQDNTNILYERIKKVIDATAYNFELIFIDNASVDKTVLNIKKLIEKDKRVRLIVNSRNFGHIRSPVYGLFQAKGDACILMASDLQDPPEVIELLIQEWERGYKTILAVKPKSKENFFIHQIRKTYYAMLTSLSEAPLISNATGFGLYDRQVIEILKKIDDPYPYFRGLLCEIGLKLKTVEFIQPKRKFGITKNNFFTLYDIGMLGLVKHSKLPLRILTILGFLLALASILAGFFYLLFKLYNWDSFALGVAPLIIGLFFLGGIQLLCMGLLGEYIGAILTGTRKLPLVVEAERINFE
jgi:glycosyltransferase involved in cell wall biosynthesis